MLTVLSVIIPVYNEADHITSLLERLRKVNWPNDVETQLLVVDDGSTDETAVAVCHFRDKYPALNLCLLQHTENCGKGQAIRTALPHVQGEYVVIQDGDEEYHPSDLPRMLETMRSKQLSVLYGSRYLAGDCLKQSLYPVFYFGVRFLSHTTNLLYGQHITDEATCYKMFRTSLLRSLHLQCRGFEFCPEVTALISRQGIAIAEVPIAYTPRTIREGKKIRFRHGLQAFWILLKYRWTKPKEL